MTAKADERWLEVAARLARRGHGGAEPNPLVGCVIVSPQQDVVGWGYHAQCGGPHAEVTALRRAEDRARGATVYVTLEPCNHTGRTGPCTEALIEAGVARVVYARPDPTEAAAGGAARLRAAGIDAVRSAASLAAIEVGEPYVHRVRSGLPWVTAKWAQTIDGRVATRSGESRWISNPSSRALVHWKRGRVDAVLTGIGTVLADDPALTPRGVKPLRTAKRVVVDPALEIPPKSALVRSARETPTIVACDEDRRYGPRATQLEAAGVTVLGVPAEDGELSLRDLLRALAREHGVATVLVESGPGLLGRLLRARLVQEAWVFVAPLLLGDDEAMACVSGLTTGRLADGRRLELRSVARRGDDVLMQYRIPTA